MSEPWERENKKKKNTDRPDLIPRAIVAVSLVWCACLVSIVEIVETARSAKNRIKSKFTQ
jgi:hypothetical protein